MRRCLSFSRGGAAIGDACLPALTAACRPLCEEPRYAIDLEDDLGRGGERGPPRARVREFELLIIKDKFRLGKLFYIKKKENKIQTENDVHVWESKPNTNHPNNCSWSCCYASDNSKFANEIIRKFV